MEKVRKLLTELSKQQIKLILKGDDLEIVSYEKKIKTEQIQEIRLLKNEIISYLKSLDRNKSLYTSSIPKIKTKLSGYSLSNAQRRLWLASQIDDGSIANNISHTVFLNGDYNVNYFQKAIHAVIERHEILRTVFRLDDKSEVLQYVLTAEELNFSIDYKDFKEEVNPEKEAKFYILSDSSKPFDLASGPLLRASLIQLSKDRYIFYYNTHHIISDDWSRKVLSSDVMTYYNSYIYGIPLDLLPLRIQYKDYAAWQLEQSNSDLYKEHKEYWISHLQGYTELIDLPSEKKRPQVKTYNGKKIGARISPEITSKLRSFTSDNGGSLFMGLLAAWKILLYRYTGKTDITIGNPVSGRDHVDLEDQIGFYVNVLALRNQIHPENNFTTFFEQIKNNTLSAYEHQTYPFDKLLEDNDVKRTTDRNPLFDILVDYHGVSETGLNLDNEDEIRNLGNCMVKYDIEFDPTEVSDGIDILIGFNTDVYEQEMIEEFVIHFKKIIEVLLEYPQKPIKQINFLSQEEEDFLLSDFRASSDIYRNDRTFIDLFLAQVSSTPDSTAVVFQGSSITYRELDSLSNQLARYLQDHGVGKETLVPICVEGALDMILGILGVLKSGGAYVPIDPNSPQQRLDFILEDTAAHHLLTHSDLSDMCIY